MINSWPRSAPAVSLRDIQASHGAVRLSELHRFNDPAEAAAIARVPRRPARSARLLPGPATRPRRRPDHHPDAVFDAWQADRSRGLDAIMLAPTRELVSRLNQQARNHRLADTAPSQEIELARQQPGQRRRPDHHPGQRPQTADHSNRLGQKR